MLQMPYLYTDSDHMWRVLDGEIGDAFLESVSADDVIGLSWYDAGARNFYNSVQPITCLEDLKGMRIRVQESDLAVDMVEALGATAIPIAYGDVYASLERQVVDGAENNWPSYEAMRHYEVAKYYTVDEHSRVPEMQICSAYTWQKLSPEDREIILECARESALYEREVWTQREEQSRSIAIENGTKVVELSAEEKKEYTAQMTANLEDLNAENEIETLIKAKGFADCLCFLQSGRADLTVMTSGEPLTAAQVAQIRDVVLNKSTVTAQNITVVEVK